jgi:proline iminopeptidase
MPSTQPYEWGWLDLGAGQQMYWAESGNPAGAPALCVHGGPGGGGRRGSRSLFDPDVFRIVLFDQRGCGESRPHASDPSVGLADNTTWHLVDDMERLRVHLGIDRWLLYGGSWGSTLILAYAEQHPARVSNIVLAGVTTSTPAEIDWLYRGAGQLLPGPWQAFRDGVPAADRASGLIAAYHRLVSSPDAHVRRAAAENWCAWEDALIVHESMGQPGSYSRRVGDPQIGFVRICTHYFAHDAWLQDGQLLNDVHRIADIPAVLIHGRHDVSSPAATARQLAAAWPAARLQIIDDAGHIGSPAMLDAVLEALGWFGGRRCR